MTCEIVTTNCLTGNAEYMTEENDSDPADEDLPRQQQYATCMSDRKYRRDSVSGWWTCRFHSGKACAGKGTEKNSSHFDGDRKATAKNQLPKRSVSYTGKMYSKYPALVRTCIRRPVMYNRTGRIHRKAGKRRKYLRPSPGNEAGIQTGKRL